MLPWETIAAARAPDGAELSLARRGPDLAVRVAGRVLMTSRQHGSEEALARLALEQLARPRAVLVGGLGMGFTLRAVLDRAPPDAAVEVAELVPALVEWNRGPLAPLAGRPLEDPRVRVTVGDVTARLRAARALDAILLDVDNGPSALAHAGNAALYGPAGVEACRAALRPGGVLAVWSAGPDEAYLARLRRAGLEARAIPVAAGAGSGRHVVFRAIRRDGARRGAPRAGAKVRRPSR